jgi:AraC-like DNA-binding protein
MTASVHQVTRDDLLERRAWAIRQVVKTLIAAHGTCAAAARRVGAQPSTLARAMKRPEGTRYDVVGRLWRAYPLAARMVAEKRQHAAGHTQRPHAVRQHHGANVVCLASYRAVRRGAVAAAPAPAGPSA